MKDLFVEVHGKKIKVFKEYWNDWIFLDLSGLKIESISEIKGLRELSELQSLDLSENQITKIEGLDFLSNLLELVLSSNQITEIEGFPPNLRILSLTKNQITEIKGLNALSELSFLELSNNRIAEIKGLDTLPNLNILKLSDNRITEIKGLDDLPTLTKLELSNNLITEIKGLDTLPNLEELKLSNNQITEIKGLDALPNLETLVLAGNRITGIKGLESLSKLRELNLAENQITEIMGLDTLFNLRRLNLKNNLIREIKGLSLLLNLLNLILEGNPIIESQREFLADGKLNEFVDPAVVKRGREPMEATRKAVEFCLLGRDFDLNKFFRGPSPKTFLIGAGCSTNPPSCLPDGRTMIEALIRFTGNESEVDELLKLKSLRFEGVMGIFQTLDPDLSVIDFYGDGETPNLQHMFLAKMIKEGHFVITTNFDFLIEHALLVSGVSRDAIVPVITEADFKRYENPVELFHQGKKMVYKLHGSTKNIITGEDTRASLVTTIQAFAANKEGMSLFQIESYKQPFFENIIKNRTLVVMGYSGSDDFDIVPALKALSNLQTVIWIHHQPNADQKVQIIEEDKESDAFEGDKTNLILNDIRSKRLMSRMYRIDVDTTNLIAGIMDSNTIEAQKEYNISPLEWLKSKFGEIKQVFGDHFTTSLFLQTGNYKSALRAAKRYLETARRVGNDEREAQALGYLSSILSTLGDFKEALQHGQRAFKLYNKLKLQDEKAGVLYNLGNTYSGLAKYKKALKHMQKALKLYKKLGDESSQAYCLISIATTQGKKTGEFNGLETYEEVRAIFERTGDLHGLMLTLNNIGSVYHFQGDHAKADIHYHEGLKIAKELNSLVSQMTFQNNLGMLGLARAAKKKSQADKDHRRKGALDDLKKAFKIASHLGMRLNMATYANNIGLAFYYLGNIPYAKNWSERAYQLVEKMGDIPVKGEIFLNLGRISEAQRKYKRALNWYQVGLEVFYRLWIFDHPSVKELRRCKDRVKNKM